MKIYVAAPWTRKAEASAMGAALEKAGHTITKKWWEHREVPGYLQTGIHPDENQELIQQAMEDIKGALEADAFVLLNLEKSEGKAVETGVALTSAILRSFGHTTAGISRMILVGGKTNLFHYIPMWEHATNGKDVVKRLAAPPNQYD